MESENEENGFKSDGESDETHVENNKTEEQPEDSDKELTWKDLVSKHVFYITSP